MLITLTNDCDASHEPIEGKCKAYVRDEFDSY